MKNSLKVAILFAFTAILAVGCADEDEASSAPDNQGDVPASKEWKSSVRF